MNMAVRMLLLLTMVSGATAGGPSRDTTHQMYWRRALDHTRGVYYYVNVRTRARRWTPPHYTNFVFEHFGNGDYRLVDTTAYWDTAVDNNAWRDHQFTRDLWDENGDPVPPPDVTGQEEVLTRTDPAYGPPQDDPPRHVEHAPHGETPYSSLQWWGELVEPADPTGQPAAPIKRLKIETDSDSTSSSGTQETSSNIMAGMHMQLQLMWIAI